MTAIYTKQPRYVATGLLALACLASGCSLISGSQQIHQSAKGAVYLEEVSEWSFEANHPTMIDQNTMLKIVKGITAEDTAPVPSKLPASGSKPMRVFSDEDAEFIAPLLAQGLSRAKPEQMVGFRVSSSAGSGAAPTAGTLYVQHGAAYVTISSPKGIKAAGFMPRSAAHIESAPSYAANGAAGAMSMVIDYSALAKASMPAPTAIAASDRPSAMNPAKTAARLDGAVSAKTLPVSNTAPSLDETTNELTTEELLNKRIDDLRLAKEANAQKESEIKILRQETEWMKKELRERTAERDAMKASNVSAKPAPKKKAAELHPSR